MYSFDGTFRSTPQVSLGNVQTLSSKDVVDASRKSREDRQRSKCAEKAVVLLQSAIRSFLCQARLRKLYRKQLLDVLEHNFSSSSLLSSQQHQLNVKAAATAVSSSSVVLATREGDVCTIIYLLYYIFNPRLDSNTWVIFSRHILQLKNNFFNILKNKSSSGWSFYIKCLFNICKKHLKYCTQYNENMTSSLRVLEFLCQPGVLTSVAANQQMFQTGFFDMLLIALRSKIKPEMVSDTISDDSEAYKRSEIYKFIIDLLRESLSLQINNSCVRETLLLNEVVLSEKNEKYSLVLIPEIAVFVNKTNLITAMESVLKVDIVGAMGEGEGSATKKSLLMFYTFLTCMGSSSAGLSGNVSTNLHSDNSSADVPSISSVMYVLSELMQRYADQINLKSQSKADHLKLTGADSDDDDEGAEDESGEEFTQNFNQNATESHLISLINGCLESNNFASFVSHLADFLCVDKAATSKTIPSSRMISDEQQLSSVICLFSKFVYNLNRINSKSRAFFALPSKRSLMQQLWRTISSLQGHSLSGQRLAMLNQLKTGHLSVADAQLLLPIVATFCRLFTLLLITLDDKELFHSDHFAFNKTETLNMIGHLKDCALGLIGMIHPESKLNFNTTTSSNSHIEMIQKCSNVFKLLCQLLKQLHDRDQRVNFSHNSASFWNSSQCSLPKPPNDMTICEALRRGVDLESIISATYSLMKSKPTSSSSAKPLSTQSAIANVSNTDVNKILSVVSIRDRRLLTVLTCLPFFISFTERVKLFRKMLSLDKMEVEGRTMPLGVGGSSISVSVRRTHVYEDAFDYLSLQNEPDLRKKIRVSWKNFGGLEEAGIDGGGLTRDFLQELVKAAFDPKLGFFATTPQGAFYPFPQVSQLMDVSSVKQHFYFIGRIVGKVLYENLLVELPLAPFFLAKILSGHVDINYLASLDDELHESLMSLKTYQGDVRDLTLTFSRTQNVLGDIQEIELIPGGREIEVTNSNKLYYIHTVADYWLNRQIKTQYSHFVAGLNDLISINWLRMFNANEVQTLISGTLLSIDIQDMRMNTNYAGGDDKDGQFSDQHPYIRTFWNILESWSDEQKSLLLKFVISCSRPPLLGFKELYPSIAIHSAGPSEDRLPTASVCMHVLKLPIYPNREILEEKLLKAIESKSGFELS